MNDSGFRDCPQCGKPIKVDATLCGFCGTRSPATEVTMVEREPTAPVLEVAKDPVDLVEVTPVAASPSPRSRSVAGRYRDAYAVAASIISRGEGMKVFAIIVAVLMGLLSLIVAINAGKIVGDGTADGLIIVGLLAAAFVGTNVHANGVRLAAEGQQLLASLDVAVNTSQFLTNDERAAIMGL